MKILVTGSGGQLGKEWCSFLNKNGIDFIGMNSKQLNILDKELIKKKVNDEKPTHIINCAAYTAVDKAEDESENAAEVNGEAVGVLAEICAEQGIKLIHYSTDYVFNGSEDDQIAFKNGYPETALINPINEYGRSKALGEKLLKESGCEYLLIRVAWLCGRHGNNFVKTMLRLAQKNQNLSIVDDQFGAPTFCEDVVNQSFQLIQHKASGTYHLGSQGCISWLNFAAKIFELADKKIELNPISSDAFNAKAKRPKFSKLDTSKFEKSMGIRVNKWEYSLEKLINQLNNEN